MSVRKPHPMHVSPARLSCPVCGKPSYSASGTHPQCAAKRADLALRAAQKAVETAAALTAPPAPAPARWAKECPRCNRQVPARRFVCECGHSFMPAAP